MSNFLNLKNSYEVKSELVTAALVTKVQTTEEVKETIWIATDSKDGSYNLMSYIFADQDSSLSHKPIKLKQAARPKLCVSVSPTKL